MMGVGDQGLEDGCSEVSSGSIFAKCGMGQIEESVARSAG